MDVQTDDTTLIRETIQTYFEALHESSGEKVKASFHARGTVSGIMSDSDLSGLADGDGDPTPGLTLVFGVSKSFGG